MKTLLIASLLLVSTSSFAITCQQYNNMSQVEAAQYVKDQVIKASHGKPTKINEFTEAQLLLTGEVLFCQK